MKKFTIRAIFALLLVSYVLSHFIPQAHASSLGIGTNEAVLPSTGLFAGLLNWINVQQQGFYRSLTGAMKAARVGGGASWLLVGLSFAYGVFHAAGPGHGKAVISSYMLANEVALRRGVLLSFLSAFLQAVSAIVMIGAVYLFLRGTTVSMTDATRALEVTSYAMIMLFGLWLLWKKAGPRVVRLAGRAPAHSLSAASALFDQPDHAFRSMAAATASRFSATDGTRAAPDAICAECGNSHMPDPALLSGRAFDWKSAWTAVVSVGLRPCTGALIVLTFALLNGMVASGVLSVLAMSLGTAITVSVLATLAVTAKNVAVAIAGNGRRGNAVHAAFEIGGALLVFVLGAMMLAASLNG